MFHLFVDHPWEVLVSHHVALLTQLADVDLAPQIGIGHDVGDVEVDHLELGRQGLLDVLDGTAGSLLGIGFGLGADDDHAAGLEDQDGGFGLGLAHDDCGEALLVVAASLHLLGDQLQVQIILDVHLGKGHHVLHQGEVRLLLNFLHASKKNQ